MWCPALAKKATLSSNNLARPKTLVHQLASRVQDYIHFPDPEPLYAVLGTVAGNMLAGTPVWLMLVGGPGTGRTTLLMTLSGLDRTHVVSNVSGPGSFLSATGRRDKTKDSDGGLLKRTGGRGLWLFKDFSTSVLAMPYEAQKQTIGVLREVFDGNYSRDAGSDGGKHVGWEGKIGLIGASTAAVDKSVLVNAELGERWTYYRYPEKEDYYGECMTALNNRLPDVKKQELREMMSAFFGAMDLEWGCRIPCEISGSNGHACRTERETRKFTHREMTRLTAMAGLGSRMRSTLTRDQYSRNEVIDVPQKEAPTRLVEELGQLYMGLEAIDLGADERWKLIGKVAMDSAPQLRVTMFKQVWQAESAGEAIGVKDLAGVLQCSEGTVRRHVEDMQAYKVLVKHSDKEIRMADWARDQVDQAGWKEDGGTSTLARGAGI